MKSNIILAILIAGALIAAIYSAPANAASFNVNVGQGGNNFSPSALTITQGDTVNWNWVGGFHNVISGSCPGGVCSADGKFNSGGAINTTGINFYFTFNTPGTYPYYCGIHLSSMQGAITVNARPAEVPEADSLALVLMGGAGMFSFLGLKWRARRKNVL